ncbi:kinesin motor domain-containing protein [Thecamonas trahens ATCC 50062]|uniref:Kinesin motor domain-containing protein n=1 Tax=Thecamonas trahens ATCC 50062 TaxID=461836 RepID=A0A0L0D4M7_THETB|nr:kinesin motor domain-containing protein [Thecamonas trahens ATCC 50062]KNC47190.1 kinesin motor domain-containing protein [Thecamonas trahens ATCC 50062]|eukprot:XP_013759961.1 kinesin motor domain-containing protein [Thecamonas trahens ATCC 50062]
MSVHQLRYSRTAGTAPQANTNNASERVKVVLRVRPTIDEDLSNARTQDDLVVGVKVAANNRAISLSQPLFDSREFRADAVLGPQATQDDMYAAVAAPVVDQVLAGFNGTVMAYGQTGSGKTYTVFGPEETVERSGDPNYFEKCGVIPRAIDHVFEHINACKETTEFRVAISCLEIYMEYVMDLFDLDKANMAVREDPESGVFVEGMQRIAVASPFDALVLIQEAFKNRAISQTYMNKTSSRSHVIVFISVEQRPIAPLPGSPNAGGLRPVKSGLLTLVDLAGSERVSKSGSDGQRLREAKRINQSLCALGNCVAALSERKPDRHIPYRNCKLTRILTDSLGGNTKTCLVATICPTVYNYEESISTCLFATRAMSVRTRARVNVTDAFSGEPPKPIQQALPLPPALAASSSFDRNLAARTYSPPPSSARKSRAPAAAGGATSAGALEPEYEYYEEEVVLGDDEVQLLASTGRTTGLTTIHPSLRSSGLLASPARADSRELIAANRALRSQVANLEAALSADVVPKSHIDELWKKREHELVAKFTRIITHMQSQIEKQAATIVSLQQRLDAAAAPAAPPAASPARSDGDIEQLVAGLLSIPSIRTKLQTHIAATPGS